MKLYDIFLFFTVLGNPLTIVSLVVALALLSWCLHRRHAWTDFFTGLAAGVGISFSIKELIHRARPAAGLVAMPASYSFPSAHALVGTVCYGLLGYYVYSYSKNIYLRIVGIVVMVGVPIMIGLSRVYLGVHWISDVFAGWALGVLILAGLITHIHHAHKRLQRGKTIPHEHLILTGIVALEAIFVFVFYFLSF